MSFQDVLARNAADKAKGIKRTYSHGGRAKIGTARKSLPVLAECVHGGTDADILERCPSCSGGGKHVRECAVHDRVTWESGGKLMDCRTCRAGGLGYLPVTAHPNILAADAFAKDLPPYPEGKSGTGEGVLFLDDTPARWERFRGRFPKATWAQTRDQFESALARNWGAVYLDYDLCNDAPGDPETWNGVVACRLLLDSPAAGAQLTVHSMNYAGAARMCEALNGAGRIAERQPFHGIAFDTSLYLGRGIVICGGGSYWPSAYVTVRMLRHVGCSVPIQVWHLGDAERDAHYAALLAPLGVECVDALAHPAAASTRGLTGFPDPTHRHGPTHPPFQLKSFAVLHSPFAEVLSLDADNYPCADPTGLFDEPRYRQTGAVFWPDLPHTSAWTRWADWGVKERGPAVGLEVGQYLIDKRLAWAPLNLMRWYDDHGDWCYGWGHHHDHGDKGPPRVAFAKLKRDYTMYSEKAVWQDIAFVQPGPDGATPLFVHRSLSKFVLDPTGFSSSPQKAPNQRAGLPLEEVAFGFLDELRRAHESTAGIRRPIPSARARETGAGAFAWTWCSAAQGSP